MQEIDYTFDAVNNITGISNVAGVLNNGLGGTYNHNYSYDNSYRLISSNGLWDNNNNSLDYQLSLTYTMDGRIKTKTQSATTLIGGALSNFSYDNHYTYYDNQPHTLKDVIDPANYQHFEWDANGNLTFHEHELNGTQRRLCWDEENRLMAVGDNNYTSYYLYDNAGERTYKLTGLNTMMNINGRWVNFATMDNPTLYTGAYLVAGIQGYTKHYYAGSERISSAIGLGGLANINDPLSIEKYENWKIKAGSLKDEMSRTINECLKNEYDIKNSFEFLHGMEEAAAGTMDRYFYHPDHLGSSSWITDGKGYAIQHLHYLLLKSFAFFPPWRSVKKIYFLYTHCLRRFGEDWVDQRNASWNAPYTFSGKEKDVETGYSYFGARYYDSGLSIWLSVDPMSDKYPNLTSYNYCYNNPIIVVDPDGNSGIIYVVDLRKDKSKNLELYIKYTNAWFTLLGIDAELVMAPDGDKTNPDYLDPTDGLMLIGNSDELQSYLGAMNFNDKIREQYKKYNFGGVYNPERSLRRFKKLIGMDFKNVKEAGRLHQVGEFYMFAFLTIHGMGHNCDLPDSDKNFYPIPIVRANNTNNANILGSGDHHNGNLKNVLTKKGNEYLIERINFYFGIDGVSDNYMKNKRSMNR